MVYTFLAACDPAAWSRIRRSDMGFIEDVAAEQGYKEAAQKILDYIILTMQSKVV